jgi:hypothetical protein
VGLLPRRVTPADLPAGSGDGPRVTIGIDEFELAPPSTLSPEAIADRS